MEDEGTTLIARLAIGVSALVVMGVHFFAATSDGANVAFVVALLVLTVAALTG